MKGAVRAVAGGVRVTFEHAPVLPAAVLELAGRTQVRRIVDCTVGGAGHARALLEAFADAQLVGFDRDPAAVQVARRRLAPFASRASVRRARFAELPAVMRELGWDGADVVLADVGVSSHQLDTAERGFSFARAAPLDMRMSPDEGEDAAALVARLDERQLTQAIRTLGEERFARRVARAIVAERPTTTDALALLVRRLVPRSADGIDPATRTFQALRMLVNDELGELAALLQAAPELLHDGGVLLVISFHSLEDRAVKHALRAHARGCICPPGLPVCGCGHVPVLEVLTSRPLTADATELAQNVRARSAKLRAARRLPRRREG